MRQEVVAKGPTVVAEGLARRFRVPLKEPGWRGTFQHLVARRHKDIDAVRDVSFVVQPGELVGFLGANGAGKTTTLKMLTGLLLPTSGRARVAGYEPFLRETAFLRDITLVMGNKQQLLWDLPALDSFRMNAAIYGINDATAKTRIAELAGMLEIEDKLTQPVRKLSLGERMKAELLASLLHQPRVLFLDEPTLGLDVNAQAAVRGFLRRYNEATGATMILTSHYMQDITALCSRVLLIHEGQLLHDGTLQALVARFAQKKEVKAELRDVDDQTDERLRVLLSAFPGDAELVQRQGRVVRVRVDPPALSTVLARLLAELEITDLVVQDPPIEELIGRALHGDLASSTPAAGIQTMEGSS